MLTLNNNTYFEKKHIVVEFFIKLIKDNIQFSLGKSVFFNFYRLDDSLFSL